MLLTSCITRDYHALYIACYAMFIHIYTYSDRQPGPGQGLGSIPGGARVHARSCRPQQHEEQRLCERGGANTCTGCAHPELFPGRLQLLLFQVHPSEAVWGASQEDLEPSQLQGPGMC